MGDRDAARPPAMRGTALMVENYHQNVHSATDEKAWVRDPIAVLFPRKGHPAASGRRTEPDWTFPVEGRTESGEKLRAGDIAGALDPTGPRASTAPRLPTLWP